MGVADALRNRRGLDSAQYAQLKAAGDRLARVFGLRLDVGRLDDGERLRLLALVRTATPESEVGYGGVAFGQLSKNEKSDLERLVEKSAGLEEGTLERRQREAKGMAKVAAIAQRAMRPPPRPVWEEPGAVTLSAETLQLVKSGHLWIEHVGLAVLLLHAFETAEALPWTTFEGSGELTLVVGPNGLSLGNFTDSDDLAARRRQLLDHLGSVGLFEIEKSGPTWRIKLGPLARKIRGAK